MHVGRGQGLHHELFRAGPRRPSHSHQTAEWHLPPVVSQEEGQSSARIGSQGLPFLWWSFPTLRNHTHIVLFFLKLWLLLWFSNSWLVPGVMNPHWYLTTISPRLAADYQRSLSVPVCIFVEDTDSYTGSIDLSCSLDLRGHHSSLAADDNSGSPASTGSFLSWVGLIAQQKMKRVRISASATGSYNSGKPHCGFSRIVVWGYILRQHKKGIMQL